MSKNVKLKTSHEFLKSYFPENIRPWKKVSKKEKRILGEKFFFLKRIKKRMKELEDTSSKNRKRIKISNKFLKQTGVLEKKIYPRFLLSIDQLKNDLLNIQSQAKPSSEYLLKIKEKKKFSLLYGKVSKKFFQKVYIQAQKERGSVSNNLINLFETRLDVILYRIFFAKTISSARQIINHNCILVNGVKIDISSYQVKPGDIIAVDHEKKIFVSNLILNNLKKRAKIRRFRFLLSSNSLKKKIRKTLNFSTQLENNFNSKKEQKTTHRKKQESPLVIQALQKVLNKLKKQLTRTKKQNFKEFRGFTHMGFTHKGLWGGVNPNQRKRKWSLDALVRLYNLKEVWKMYLLKLKNTPSAECSPYSFTKKKKQKFFNLQLKRLMARKLSRSRSLACMQISPMKPLHLEVSYRQLKAIFLYYPQKVVYSATINLDLLCRSIL